MVSTRRTSRRFVGALAAAGLVAALASPASAFRMIQNTGVGRFTAGPPVSCDNATGFTHWDNNGTFNWFHNTAGQGAEKAAALQNALAAWTNVAGANHVLTYAGTTSDGWATDGRNTVLWAVGNGCTGGCLALTALVLQSGQVIVESDITFNESFTWNTNGTDFDTEGVAVHEFGHTLGIHHTELTSTPRPSMFASYFGTDMRSVEADDQAALQCSQNRYPPCTSAPQTPATLNVINEQCRGLNSMEWTASRCATSYEVYRSTSPTFATQFLEYSGSGTTDFINVSTTTYVRVRACNAFGCSGYRNGDTTARFVSGCL